MNCRGLIQMAIVCWLILAIPLANGADFLITDTQGVSHSLDAHRGKWVLVNFWATWCPPCLDEIPEFSALYNDRKNRDLTVIGIAVDYDDAKQVLQFAKKLNLNYPLVMGDDDVTKQFARVSALPVSILYDPKGRQVLRRMGTLSRAELEKLIGK